jgi:hypothetical protein
MNMNEQQYVSPFATSAHEGDRSEAADLSPGWALRAFHEGMQQAEEEIEAEQALAKQVVVGFKAPVPWDGWTEEQRRAEYGGFLYPSWYPFAALEGNFSKSPYLPDEGRKATTPKVQGVVDEAIEIRKKQFAVPMANKASYTPHVPAGALKRN